MGSSTYCTNACEDQLLIPQNSHLKFIPHMSDLFPHTSLLILLVPVTQLLLLGCSSITLGLELPNRTGAKQVWCHFSFPTFLPDFKELPSTVSQGLKPQQPRVVCNQPESKVFLQVPFSAHRNQQFEKTETIAAAVLNRYNYSKLQVCLAVPSAILHTTQELLFL